MCNKQDCDLYHTDCNTCRQHIPSGAFQCVRCELLWDKAEKGDTEAIGELEKLMHLEPNVRIF